MDPLVTSFQGFVADLRSVEKRSIVALTEIARDALRTHPHLAPTLATVLINRIFEAPADIKLPPFYLLDSISKTIGEPYKTYFAASLPELYADAWTVGAPGLHRPLEKLLATWVGVFPPHVLDAVRARAATPYVHPRPPPAAAAAYPGYPPAQPQQQYDYYGAPAGGHKPMMPDARLTTGGAAGGATAAYPSAPAAQPAYDYYGGGGYAQPPAYGAPQQPAGGYYAGGAPAAPAAAPTPAAPVPDLFSLLSSGALAGVAAAAAGKEAAAAPKADAGTAPAAAASKRIGIRAKGRPQPQEFSNDAIKEPNSGAVDRLLGATAATRSSFLDRLFVRRQVREGGNRTSRQWYVDLDTWMAGTTGAGAPAQGDAAAAGGSATAAAGTAAPEPDQRYTVEADDEQTHCALSGERFDQFWDEDRQEWRYRDARRLDADEAAAYGLEEGAIVLVSALGGGPPAVGGGEMDAGVKKEEAEGTAAAVAKEEGDGDEPAAKRVKKE